LSDPKKFLIILINYSNWKDTIECIDSLFDAGIHSYSILVIDNGSENDSILNLKEKCPSIEIIKNKENIGFSAANNIGINKAISNGYSYAILLNNDTIVSPNAISELIAVMDKFKDASLGTGQIRMYPDKNKIWYAGGRIIGWRGLAVHFLVSKDVKKAKHHIDPQYVTFISGCYLCIRIQDIIKLGLLDERFFIYLEDVAYSARAVKRGCKLLYIPTSVIFHKWKGETKLKYQTLYYAVRNRNLLINIFFPFTAKIYFRIIIFLKMIYWFVTDKELFKAAKKGLEDYRKNFFGEIRHKMPKQRQI